MNSFSQSYFPVKYRIEKQSISTPMTPLYDVFFDNYFYIKPVNIYLNDSVLNILYDNEKVHISKKLTKIDYIRKEYNNELEYEYFFFIDNDILKDTILFIVDHLVDSYNIIFPVKNSKNKNIGYKSYRYFK